MKARFTVLGAALLLTGTASAQQLEGVTGHPENALILIDPAKSLPEITSSIPLYQCRRPCAARKDVVLYVPLRQDRGQLGI